MVFEFNLGFSRIIFLHFYRKIYNEISLFYSLYMKKKDSEIQTTVIKKINDIYENNQIKDVDISWIFLLTETRVIKELFKKNTRDLVRKYKKSLFFSIYPKIKLIKLIRPFNQEIKKTKKHKPVILSTFIPKKAAYTLDLENIKYRIFEENGTIFDMKLPQKSKWKFVLKYKFSAGKILLSFTLLFLFLFWYGLTTKSYIEKTFIWIQQINLQDIDTLHLSLSGLKKDLVMSEILLTPLLILNYFVGNSSVENLGYILPAMTKMVNFWIHTIEIFEGTKSMIQEKWMENIMFSQLLENIEPLLGKMQIDLQSAMQWFQSVWVFEDQNINTQFQKYKDMGLQFQNIYQDVYSEIETIKNILWHSEARTYMIVFQNNDEIRPTGGFMGSVGLVSIFRWKIINFENKDIYAIEWDLKDFATKNGVAFEQRAPEWLNQISATFWLRDANYHPDIRKSSQEIKQFLEKSNQYNIDGIVYINQNLILNILQKIGPIYYEAVSREVTSENFSVLFSTLVEAKVTKTHTLATPKQILFDFIEIFLEKLKNESDYKMYTELFLESLEKKDILFTLFDENENNFLQTIWLQKNYQFDQYLDFNYPVFTSISGNKSDRYMVRNFEKQVTLGNNCEIQSRFEIKQRHTFNINEEINIKNILYDHNILWETNINTLLDIQWKGLNKQYIRVFIPKNAQVLPKQNFKIQEFENYKEISFYLTTNTLFESKMDFEYTLANPECIPYEYLFIKQPWIKKYRIDMIKNWNLEQSLYTETDFIFK